MERTLSRLERGGLPTPRDRSSLLDRRLSPFGHSLRAAEHHKPGHAHGGDRQKLEDCERHNHDFRRSHCASAFGVGRTLSKIVYPGLLRCQTGRLPGRLTFRRALGIVSVGPHPGELAPRLLTVLRTTDNLNREVCGAI